MLVVKANRWLSAQLAGRAPGAFSMKEFVLVNGGIPDTIVLPLVAASGVNQFPAVQGSVQ
jgi:hypothetical protein